MPSFTRGSLPSSVYWRRRLVLLTVAVILVVAIAKLLDHGSDASSASPGPGAQGVAQITTESPSTALSPTKQRTRHSPSPSMPTSTAPAEPTGSCQRSDVLVTPSVEEAVVGEPVSITLEVSTVSEPACYWRLSPHTAQVRISRGGGTVWSTVDCGVAVPRQQVVARQGDPASVTLSWAGHRSDSVCSSHDPWAGPGRYWISAAALGGEPATSSFVMLKTPPAPSASATPDTTATADTTATPGATGSTSSIATPTTTASPTHGAKRSESTAPTRTAD